MYNFTITAPVSMFISLAALTGVSLHDTKIDKLTTSIVGVPSIMSSTESATKGLSTDPHTHVERVSLNESRSTQLLDVASPPVRKLEVLRVDHTKRADGCQ